MSGKDSPTADDANALANTVDHEVVHTSRINGGHSSDPSNLMFDGMNPYVGGTLTDAQKKQLQDKYNRPGEVDKTKPQTPQPPPDKKPEVQQ